MLVSEKHIKQSKMMAFQFIVALFILVSYGEGHKTDCLFHNYAGGPGEVIATFKPTLPGKISLEFGSKTLSIFAKIVGFIPEVGGALSRLFGIIGDLTDNTVDNMKAFQKAINDLTDDIRKTVEDLKKYVDAKFDEYDYDKKSETLKGIYEQSRLCASFSSPSEKEFCLKDLMLGIVRLYPTFFTTEPKYETFEQLLPMTRQLADLQFATLLDTLNFTKVDPDYKMLIANFSVIAYNYFVHGINSIVNQHLNNTQAVSCKAVDEADFCNLYVPDQCVCLHISAFTCEQEWDNEDGCRCQNPDPKDTSSDSNCIYAVMVYQDSAIREIKDKLAPYHSNLELNIRKYWKADVGQTMEHWKELDIKAGAKESSYLPYCTEPTLSKGGVSYRGKEVAKYIAELVKFVQNELKAKLPRKISNSVKENLNFEL